MVADTDKRTKNTLMLSLGGNSGDVTATFKVAIEKINTHLGELNQMSSLYKTKPWGIEDQPDFLNQIISVKTALSPVDCLKIIQQIELELGRVRKGEQWGERPIDIDILFYNDEKIDLPNLKIPHPYIQERNFILIPLNEICPDYIHPVLQESVMTLREKCDDALEVIKISS